MRIRSLLALVVLALAVAVPSVSEAQRAKRIGFVVPVKVNVTDAEAQSLASALGDAVASEYSIEAIAGAEAERRLPPEGLPDECVASNECRSDIGRRLDSEELVFLVIVKIGDEVQVDATWAHVGSGDTTSRPKISLKGDGLDADALAVAATKLLPYEKPTEPEATPAPVREVVVIPTHKSEPEGRSLPATGWVAAGVSATSLVAASIFAVSARSRFNSLDAEGCRTMACDPERISTLATRARTADILFGVSGVAAATALILYLTNDAPEPEKAEGATLRAGPGAFGFAVGGSF